jgi:hypothetical protein
MMLLFSQQFVGVCLRIAVVMTLAAMVAAPILIGGSDTNLPLTIRASGQLQ